MNAYFELFLFWDLVVYLYSMAGQICLYELCVQLSIVVFS